MSLMSMSHVSGVNAVMSLISMSHVSLRWLPKGVLMSHVSHVNESCLRCQWVMSLMLMSHVSVAGRNSTSGD